MKDKLLFALEFDGESIELDLLGKQSVTLNHANAVLLSRQLMHFAEKFPSPAWEEFSNEIIDTGQDRVTGIVKAFLESDAAGKIVLRQVQAAAVSSNFPAFTESDGPKAGEGGKDGEIRDL
jgi:hypothetical protein